MMQHTRLLEPRKASSSCYVVLTAAILLLAGCATDGSTGSFFGTGTAENTVGGSTPAMLGDTALGGITGSALVNRPVEDHKQAQAGASRDQEDQRRHDYARQSRIQQDQVRKEIEAQRLYERWKREHGS